MGVLGERAAQTLREGGLEDGFFQIEWMTTPQPTAELKFGNVLPSTSPLHRIPVLDFVWSGLFHECGYDGINQR